MKLWILLMIGYGIYFIFFKKSPEVLEDPTETPKDSMLVTYSPREDNGGKHETRPELTEGAKRLMQSNIEENDRESFKEIFGDDFLDKNAEDTPFTEV